VTSFNNLRHAQGRTPCYQVSNLLPNFKGLCLWNEACYTHVAQCVANYKGSPTSSQNDMNFGPQTVSNWKSVLTHPLKILHSTSLPSFAEGDQQTELNQTLPKGEW